MALPTAVVCSYRLGAHDGVSVEAAKWAAALSELGFSVRTVAGTGRADHLVAGLGLDPRPGPDPGPDPVELAAALAGAEVVVVENCCSLPLNPAASAGVAAALAGRPAILHHHDLALERSELAHHGPPPDDPCWRHVCVSKRAAGLLEAEGIAAEVVYNAFDPSPRPGNRSATRELLGVAPSDRLVLQPTRAIARKDVAAGLGLAEALGAAYWLTGPAEDGYDEELAAVLQAASTRVLHRPAPGGGPAAMADAYAACDLVTLPSRLEGFGNPAVESAAHRRPLAVGPYPVASELRRHGFSWFDLDDLAALDAFLDDPDEALLDHNAGVVAAAFDLADLPAKLAPILSDCLGAPVGPVASGTGQR